MPLTRDKKAEILEKYRGLVKDAPALVFTNYRGISVKQINSLRAKMKDQGADYAVVKNTLLRIALEEVGRAAPESLLSGPNGVVFVGEDIAKTVTALKTWIKDSKIGEITGALLENSPLDAANAEKLADLPTKEQVLASILGTINAPAGSLVRIINAPLSSLVRVINAHVEKQSEVAA